MASNGMGFKVKFALLQFLLAHVRLGSEADMTPPNCDVRFTPKSGHPSASSRCQLWADFVVEVGLEGGWADDFLRPAFSRRRVKGLDCHAVKALLTSRALLVKIKRDLENQIRGLLKNLGRVIGRAKFNGFAARAAELIEDRPELVAVVTPLLKAREAIEKQIDDLDRKVLKLARHDAQIRRFMTVPGIGPVLDRRLSP
jgi:hypothetical protein